MEKVKYNGIQFYWEKYIYNSFSYGFIVKNTIFHVNTLYVDPKSVVLTK